MWWGFGTQTKAVLKESTPTKSQADLWRDLSNAMGSYTTASKGDSSS